MIERMAKLYATEAEANQAGLRERLRRRARVQTGGGGDPALADQTQGAPALCAGKGDPVYGGSG
jgi:hypothetical protein